MSVSEKTTVIPDSHRDLLESKALAHVATIGPDGEPQANPVWFGWDGKHLKFSQTTTRQKAKNLDRDPRIALSIVDPENPYRYLEVRGKQVRVDADPDKAFIDEMSNKYMGVEKYPWNQPGEHRVVIVVEPEHTTSMG
ncbi:PPOX class F420-dependent oxidoreductase [soil metagenome]